ncbi:MAG: M20/M25/M40 family metallo-hydrolase [Bacteroidales bacterium]|nr:M20/M25/M40 family metallo-hydrolase [Bacteroidales bacterium]
MERTDKAIELLKVMVETPSPSFEEERVSCAVFSWIENYLRERKIEEKTALKKVNNNILLYAPFNREKTLMMCAHLDTVAPSADYTYKPYTLTVEENKLIGLGTNDDGASVVSMLMAFCQAVEKNESNVNLLLVLSTEEEKSGPNGMYSVISYLNGQVIPFPDFAIVGEPTSLKAAVAERGLIVLDGTALGKSCHAAQDCGTNAIYVALEDIEKIKNFKFDRKPSMVGEVHVAVTQINAGTAHNVVPDKCTFVVDIRPNELYDNQEIVDMLQKEVKSTLKPRTLYHKVSATPKDHLLIKAIKELGIESYISPTTSDWTRLSIPAIKIGPGESARSHKADEYILKEEIEKGIETYTGIIETINKLIG